jgi:hypothetical protein
VGGVVGGTYVEGPDGDREVGTFGSLALGTGLGVASVYAEAFATRASGGPASIGSNLGAAVPVGVRGQVDASVTLGIGDEGPPTGVNVGTSWLW